MADPHAVADEREPVALCRTTCRRSSAPTRPGSKNVSSSFGHQIALDAIWGIIVSLVLIVIYITLRFDVKFAIPVILAMLHDIVITVGVYSIAFKEVSVATVAAVLTVLGYSIYDTIIIFDRVRENIPLMRRQPFATIVERLAVGDDPPLAGDDVHHAAADRRARDLRRRDAEGLRVRAHRRRHLRCVLVDLHRGAAAHDLEGARAGVREAQAARAADEIGRPVGGRRPPRRRLDAGTVALEASEQALAAEPTPELVDVVDAAPSEPDAQARREKRRQRRRTRPHGRAR